MKKIFFVLLFLAVTVCVNSYSEEKETPNMLGLAAMFYNSPYKGKDTDVTAVPVIQWKKKPFFIRGTQAGVIVIEADIYEANFFISPRLMGYDAGDSSALRGMQDRDYSLDAGVGFSAVLEDLQDTTISISCAGDLLSEHQGYSLTLATSNLIDWTPFFIKPSCGIEWQSRDLTDYYYGVRPQEAITGRPAYSADNALNFFTMIDFYLALSKEWIIVTRASVNFLSNEITDSPIVDEDYTLGGIIGIARMF